MSMTLRKRATTATTTTSNGQCNGAVETNGSSSRPDLSKNVESKHNGLRRMAPVIGGLVSVLLLVYVALYFYWYNHVDTMPTMVPPPHESHCTTTPCSRSDLLAFQVASFMAIFTCAILGGTVWHVRGVPASIAGSSAARLLGYHSSAEYLAAVNLSFQIWDFIVSSTIPEHCTWIMMTHHVLAATVAYFSIRYSILNYYGIFFLGCSEISSVFLVLVNSTQYFPIPEGTTVAWWLRYDQIQKAALGPIFVAAFFYYRVYLWWIVSYQLYRDIMTITQSTSSTKSILETERPLPNDPPKWVLFSFLAINLPLGILQLYWFGIILVELVKVYG
jgi:TLC domain